MALVAISTDAPADALSMAGLVGAGFAVLADEDTEVTRAFGVYDLLGDGVATPATFIVGQDGEIKWSYIGQDIADRTTVPQILDQVDQLLN